MISISFIRRRAAAMVATLVAGLVIGLPALAAGPAVQLDTFPVSKLNDKAALQAGAKVFVNQCLGCHGLSAVRYNRLTDLGLNEDQIKTNLILTEAKYGDYIKTTMNLKDAAVWFGKAPPDLSLTARSRSGPGTTGADWIYSYLRTYYPDDSRPTGWNNKVYPNVGMPHVLWEQQKTMSKSDYDNYVGDLTAFLAWSAEPVAQSRKQTGVWVLLFLGLFFVLAWRLNASYWKDIK
jgi:ubiquinol-cytochrome c reductase cytochrome c1 subunit